MTKQESVSAKSSGNHDRIMYTFHCDTCDITWQTDNPTNKICETCWCEAEEVC